MALTHPAIDIPNLLYRYAELLDGGDLDAAAALFDQGAIITMGERVEGRDKIADCWREWMRLYEGRPRTRHIMTNPIIELADDGLSATCRSQYTVLQALDGFPLQPVISGRYRDRLAVIDGAWRFVEREYAEVDLIGDLSAHLLQPLDGKSE
jgi:3-phenylpropionate/cinnamic acid dioxygenase small subunit